MPRYQDAANTFDAPDQETLDRLRRLHGALRRRLTDLGAGGVADGPYVVERYNPRMDGHFYPHSETVQVETAFGARSEDDQVLQVLAHEAGHKMLHSVKSSLYGSNKGTLHKAVVSTFKAANLAEKKGGAAAQCAQRLVEIIESDGLVDVVDANALPASCRAFPRWRLTPDWDRKGKRLANTTVPAVTARPFDAEGNLQMLPDGRIVRMELNGADLLCGIFKDPATGVVFSGGAGRSAWFPSPRSQMSAEEWFAEIVAHWVMGRLGAEPAAWLVAWVSDAAADLKPVQANA